MGKQRRGFPAMLLGAGTVLLGAWAARRVCRPLWAAEERAIDIARRREAEELLRESEQRLRLAQQAARIGTFDRNMRTGVNIWSPELEAMHGLRPGAFGGTRAAWEKLVHPDDRAAAVALAKRAVESDQPVEGEWRVRWPDGSVHWLLGRYQVFRDGGGNPLRMTGVNIDITARKTAEEIVRQANQNLEQQVQQRTEALAAAMRSAERANAAKDHFLAVLSHELRNPLAPVLPALTAVQELVPGEGKELLEIARRNVELEARLIDDLLDVTRIARGKVELTRQVVDMRTILQRAAEVCRPDIEARRLNFGIKIEGGPHLVEVDPARIQQLFWNLIKNAVKFTSTGGRVEVRCWREGDEVMSEVIDSGEGIAPDALARVFNAFEQESRATTRQFGGLGLGLAISKALVELHGGSIRAYSAGKGQGAAFTVALPLVPSASIAEPAARAAFAGSGLSLRPRKILLVEDHGDTAKVLRRLFIAQGHSVQHAGDVATALELAAGETFDVLVSDLGLPDGTGLDLIRELRARGQHLAAIAVSGFGMIEDVQKSHEAGFAEHLTKPVDFEVLLATIDRVARGATAGAVPAHCTPPPLHSSSTAAAFGGKPVQQSQ